MYKPAILIYYHSITVLSLVATHWFYVAYIGKDDYPQFLSHLFWLICKNLKMKMYFSFFFIWPVTGRGGLPLSHQTDDEGSQIWRQAPVASGLWVIIIIYASSNLTLCYNIQ